MLDLNSVKSETGFPPARRARRAHPRSGRHRGQQEHHPRRRPSPLWPWASASARPWLTQRGFGPAEMDEVAEADPQDGDPHPALQLHRAQWELPRGKIDLEVLRRSNTRWPTWPPGALPRRRTARGQRISPLLPPGGRSSGSLRGLMPAPGPDWRPVGGSHGPVRVLLDLTTSGLLLVVGERAEPSLQQVLTSDVAALSPATASLPSAGRGRPGDRRRVDPAPADGRGTPGSLSAPDERREPRAGQGLAAGLGDGYTLFEPDDLFRKVEGPIIVEDLRLADPENCTVTLACGAQGGRVLAMLGSCPAIRFFHGPQRIELAVPAARCRWSMIGWSKPAPPQPARLYARPSAPRPACPTITNSRLRPRIGAAHWIGAVPAWSPGPL
jgi:hypothetical protein